MLVLRGIRWLLSLIGLPGDIETLGRWLAAWGLFSAVTGGWLAYLDLWNNWPWAVFVASGIFCFGTITYIQAAEAIRRKTLEDKLYLNSLVADQIPTSGGKCTVKLIIELNTCAYFPLFWEITKEFYAIGKSTSAEEGKPNSTGMIPANGRYLRALITVYDVDQRWQSGNLMLSLRYGKRRDKRACEMVLHVAFSPFIIPPLGFKGRNELKFDIISLE